MINLVLSSWCQRNIGSDDSSTWVSYDLAKEFNQFYHDFSILKEDNSALKNVRLLLAKVCAEAIKNAMGMLGIEMPERM